MEAKNQKKRLTPGQYRNHDYAKPNDEQDLEPFEYPLQVSIELAILSFSYDLEIHIMITHPYAACVHECYAQQKYKRCRPYTETATPVLRKHRCSDDQRDHAHAVRQPEVPEAIISINASNHLQQTSQGNCHGPIHNSHSKAKSLVNERIWIVHQGTFYRSNRYHFRKRAHH